MPPLVIEQQPVVNSYEKTILRPHCSYRNWSAVTLKLHPPQLQVDLYKIASALEGKGVTYIQ